MKCNAVNERIKRKYFRHLRESIGYDHATIDGVAKAIARFESYTGHKDFKVFHVEQAIGFKRKLTEADNPRTGEPLAKGTQLSTLRALKEFFRWLSREPGYKSRVEYSSASYFSLPRKDVTIAQTRREKRVPTLAQIDQVLKAMPSGTIIERRDRAIVAFAAVAKVRVSALASIRLGDVNIAERHVYQDARHVRTKARKSIGTDLVPVMGDALQIVIDWHAELTADPTRGPETPLFPSTATALDDQGAFRAIGLTHTEWKSTNSIREIFKCAFAAANLPYFNPHSFRSAIARHITTLGLGPEAMVAVAQNMGHNEVLTTFTSYGNVTAHRQSEIIRALPDWRSPKPTVDKDRLLAKLADMLGDDATLPQRLSWR